jgi:hypothetical protein
MHRWAVFLMFILSFLFTAAVGADERDDPRNLAKPVERTPYNDRVARSDLQTPKGERVCITKKNLGNLEGTWPGSFYNPESPGYHGITTIRIVTSDSGFAYISQYLEKKGGRGDLFKFTSVLAPTSVKNCVLPAPWTEPPKYADYALVRRGGQYVLTTHLNPLVPLD